MIDITRAGLGCAGPSAASCLGTCLGVPARIPGSTCCLSSSALEGGTFANLTRGNFALFTRL